MVRYLLPVIAVLLVFTVSCKKDRNYIHARIEDTGNTSSTGCGYLLLYDDGSEQKPDYLPSAFRHDSMEVKVDVVHTGGLSNCNPLQQYEIVTIKDIERAL